MVILFPIILKINGFHRTEPCERLTVTYWGKSRSELQCTIMYGQGRNKMYYAVPIKHRLRLFFHAMFFEIVGYF